jgi:hypothetical protein
MGWGNFGLDGIELVALDAQLLEDGAKSAGRNVTGVVRSRQTINGRLEEGAV